MNAAIRRSRLRCIDILRCIDQGISTVDTIADALPWHRHHDVQMSIYTLRRKHQLIESSRKAQGGRPALYELTVPIEQAIAKIEPPTTTRRMSFGPLTEALGIPSHIEAMFGTTAKPTIVRPMGKWTDKPGRPKGIARARA